MRIGRTVPPAAAPLCWSDLWHGISGLCSPQRARRALEAEMRRHFGVEHVFLVSSGTAALAVTLTALRSLSPRTDVVIPAYTCFSVPAAVLHADLRPVPCDINPATFDFDHALLEQTLSADTLCVIAHHLFGIPSDIGRIRDCCEGHRILVVEDAAQGMGAESSGRRLGTLGDVGIFSLGRGKNITCGAGGVIVTNRADIAAALEEQYRRLPAPHLAELVKDVVQLLLMMVFIRPWLYWIPAAIPGLRLGETVFPNEVPRKRLSGMKAGLLRRWRNRLTGSNQVRSQNAAAFSRQLALRLPCGPSHPYLRLPLLVETPEARARIQSLSRLRGLGLSSAYPTPVDEIPEVRAHVNGHRFPSAQRVAARLLTLPTHHWLTERDRAAIAQLCRDRSCRAA